MRFENTCNAQNQWYVFVKVSFETGRTRLFEVFDMPAILLRKFRPLGAETYWSPTLDGVTYKGKGCEFFQV